MAEEFQSKTEAPTQRRRDEARDQGQVAVSPELTSALVLLAGVAALALGGGTLAGGLLDSVNMEFAFAGQVPDLGVGQTCELFLRIFGRAMELMGFLLGLVFVVGVAAGILQAGFRMTPDLLAMNWERLSPVRGWSRVVSAAGVVKGVTALVKVAAVALVAWWVLRARLANMAELQGATLAGAVAQAWQTVVRLALAIAGMLGVIGAVDYLWQRWRLEQSLRMSRQELKQEAKDDQGDPLIKARVRKLQREAAQKRMFGDVPRATLVVTNPTHLAVALHYDKGAPGAPKVVAKGAGFVARRIVALARQHAVPVVERKPVAQALFKAVKVGQEIPAGLYQAIAEILAFVYRQRGT